MQFLLCHFLNMKYKSLNKIFHLNIYSTVALQKIMERTLNYMFSCKNYLIFLPTDDIHHFFKSMSLYGTLFYQTNNFKQKLNGFGMMQY